MDNRQLAMNNQQWTISNEQSYPGIQSCFEILRFAQNDKEDYYWCHSWNSCQLYSVVIEILRFAQNDKEDYYWCHSWNSCPTKTYKTKKSLATWVKTLLREHYMKMKKLLSELLTLLKYHRYTCGRKLCCERPESCGNCQNLKFWHKKSALLGAWISCKRFIPLAVHWWKNEILEILGNRYQIIIDHNILGIDGIYMVHIYDIGFVCPIKLILWQFL